MGVSLQSAIGRVAIATLAIAGCGNRDQSVQPCEVGALLTQSPVVSPDDVEAVERDIAAVAPLGKFAVPGHVFPTSHVDFETRLEAGVPLAIDVFAPARITITRIMKDAHQTSDSEPALDTDYRVDFSVCEDVTGYFTRLQSLSDELLDSKSVRGPTLEAGTSIGTAARGTPQTGLGFGLLDSRSPSTVANPHRWQSAERTSVCPFDYFEEGSALQNALYDKLGSAGMPRERPPACGTAYWDEPGTARGVWFVPGLPARPEAPHITLAYYNMDGQSGVFALGSSVYETSEKFGLKAALGDGDPDYPGNRAYLFTTGTSETRDVNTPFEDITRGDPMIHCYEHLREQSAGQELDAVIFLALDSNDQLSLQVVPGSPTCVPRNERRFGESVLHYER